MEEMEMMTEDIFRERLREAMKARGVTGSMLANVLDVSARTPFAWMSGSNLPRLTYLPEIAKVLGVSTDWLLGMET